MKSSYIFIESHEVTIQGCDEHSYFRVEQSLVGLLSVATLDVHSGEAYKESIIMYNEKNVTLMFSRTDTKCGLRLLV